MTSFLTPFLNNHFVILGVLELRGFSPESNATCIANVVKVVLFMHSLYFPWQNASSPHENQAVTLAVSRPGDKGGPPLSRRGRQLVGRLHLTGISKPRGRLMVKQGYVKLLVMNTALAALVRQRQQAKLRQ